MIGFKDTRALLYPTIRHTECALLLSQSAGDRCDTCVAYRNTLNKAIARKRKATMQHSHTNYRYLSSPEKVTRLRELQRKNHQQQNHIARLREKLAELTEKNGVYLDQTMNNDLEKIVKEEDKAVMDRYPKDSFLQIFWQHQKEALTKHPNGMRWHPLMIRLD